MGRQAYLTHLAWGRSVWSRPESNGWFVQNGEINWDEFIRQRRNAPLEGQRPEHVQEYNSSLHPINPESRHYGKAMERSANTILSLLGVVVPSDGAGSDREISSRESDLVFPIGFATELIKELATTWVANLTGRLLAFPPDPDSSFSDIVIRHYHDTGPFGFFFAGLPSALIGFPALPAILDGQLSYLAYRLIVAFVSSAKARQKCFDAAPFARQILDFSLTLLQWPFRLHATLQRVGLVPTHKLLPDPSSYVPFWGTSPIQFLNTPLPILLFLLYNPTRISLVRSLLPLLSFSPLLPKAATNGPDHNRTSNPNSESDVSKLSFLHQISSFFHDRFRLPILSQFHTGNQTLPLATVAPTSLSVDAGATTPPATTNATVHNWHPDAPGEPTAHPETTAEATSQEQIPGQEMSPSDEDDRDQSSEDLGRPEARIRIASMDMASGTINLQVEIGVAEETLEQMVDTNAQREGTAAPRDVTASMPPSARTVSELVLLPWAIGHQWAIHNVASLMLLPASTFVLRGLTSHYLKNGGFGVTPSLVGTSIGKSVLNAGPLLSWSNAQSIGSYASKLGICLLIRYTLETGVLAMNSFTVSWIGRNYFGWKLS